MDIENIESIGKLGKVIITDYKPIFKSIIFLMILTIVELIIIINLFGNDFSLILGLLVYANITLYLETNKKFNLIQFKNNFYALEINTYKIYDLGNKNNNLKHELNKAFSKSLSNYFIFIYVFYIVITYFLNSSS